MTSPDQRSEPAVVPRPARWRSLHGVTIVWLTVVMGVLIYVRHRDNIRRLLKGEEPRIGGGKGAPAA